MPDLLLELFSEEIPARMQARAAEDLRKAVTERLVEASLVYEGAKAFATPRRLALTVQGVPARQPDLREERKGPRVGAPEAAVAGFLKSAGLKSLDEATVQRDPKKGDFYVALVEKPGRPAIDVLAEFLPVIVRTFPWPKSMRWGDGRLAWVRPLHSIVATFGPETEEPDIVPFKVDHIIAGDETRGHRFLAPKPFHVKRFDDYVRKLEKAKVVLDPARRKDIILHDARHLAFAQGLELVEDDGLLDEVAGLVEWPVVLMGSFDPAFLAIPPEIIRATIRANQKCFVARDPKTDNLAPKFILVSNIEAKDGGEAIIAGNERVIRARLSDAKFFYETDLKNWREIPLEQRLNKFESIVFHEKLGTQAERIARIERLAGELAPLLVPNASEAEKAELVEKAKRAARLCKADLLTEVVGEFPELQGLMGRYYALAQGEDASVAAACEEHYKPLGPSDRVPTDPVSVSVALADKIDTLVGFWAIGEKPTGSKDPYALRRAALGVIRLILDNGLGIKIARIASPHFAAIDADSAAHIARSKLEAAKRSSSGGLFAAPPIIQTFGLVEGQQVDKRSIDLLSFFADRLKVQLREQGLRHDLVDAVFAQQEAGSAGGATGTQQEAGSAGGATGTQQEAGSAGGATGTQHLQDDLLLVVRRVEALARFLDTEDGKNLLAGYKRATNILRIEEKRDKASYAGAPDSALYRQAEEWELQRAIDDAKAEAQGAVAREDFAAAMSAMAKLRPHVDAYFDKVTVNAPEADVRANRLRLLNEIRAATLAVADFSKIEG